jgi:DNA-directed RNA polymerase subunit M
MFCPECGTLAFPDKDGMIKCPNYQCGETIHKTGKARECDGCGEIFAGDECPECGRKRGVKMVIDGIEVEHTEFIASTKAEERDRRVIVDSEQQQGVLTTNTYICPKCDSDSVYAELKQTRASDEPETRILTCAECRHGWREY